MPLAPRPMPHANCQKDKFTFALIYNKCIKLYGKKQVLITVFKQDIFR
jgi:hypothetical protein